MSDADPNAADPLTFPSLAAEMAAEDGDIPLGLPSKMVDEDGETIYTRTDVYGDPDG